MSKPSPEFSVAFSREVRHALVTAVSDAYDSACEAHALLQGRGSNEQLFGYTVYQCVREALRKLGLRGVAALRVARDANLFRLGAGPFELGAYRVGKLASEDIWTAFPNNDNGAGAMVGANQYLPGMEPDVALATQVVLAHFGNSDDGLTAAYLTIPTREEDGQIREWGHAELLWRSDGERTAPLTKVPETPPETTPEPVVRPRPQRITSENHD